MDEISPQGVTDVWEVRGGAVLKSEIDPATHGVAVADVSALRGGEPSDNAARIERLLGGKADGDFTGRAAVLLNAGAAIYVSGLAATYAEGITRAAAALASGAGLSALERLRRASTSTSE
jgi:anthranilate phosphoribosyltransferase